MKEVTKAEDCRFIKEWQSMIGRPMIWSDGKCDGYNKVSNREEPQDKCKCCKLHIDYEEE